MTNGSRLSFRRPGAQCQFARQRDGGIFMFPAFPVHLRLPRLSSGGRALTDLRTQVTCPGVSPASGGRCDPPFLAGMRLLSFLACGTPRSSRPALVKVGSPRPVPHSPSPGGTQGPHRVSASGWGCFRGARRPVGEVFLHSRFPGRFFS